VAPARPEPRAQGDRPSRRTNAARLARQLALAHWIERAVEAGQAASYGEVARILGLTESRVTQITALLGLSPAVQEGILLGEGGVGIRVAIRAAREVEWGGRSSAHVERGAVAHRESRQEVQTRLCQASAAKVAATCTARGVDLRVEGFKMVKGTTRSEHHRGRR